MSSSTCSSANICAGTVIALDPKGSSAGNASHLGVGEWLNTKDTSRRRQNRSIEKVLRLDRVECLAFALIRSVKTLRCKGTHNIQAHTAFDLAERLKGRIVGKALARKEQWKGGKDELYLQ